MDEFVVDRGVSRYGVHTVHVLRAGESVDREAWIRQELPEEYDAMEFFEYEDQELGMWHLMLWWKEKGARCYDGWIRE